MKLIASHCAINEQTITRIEAHHYTDKEESERYYQMWKKAGFDSISIFMYNESQFIVYKRVTKRGVNHD